MSDSSLSDSGVRSDPTTPAARKHKRTKKGSVSEEEVIIKRYKTEAEKYRQAPRPRTLSSSEDDTSNNPRRGAIRKQRRRCSKAEKDTSDSDVEESRRKPAKRHRETNQKTDDEKEKAVQQGDQDLELADFFESLQIDDNNANAEDEGQGAQASAAEESDDHNQVVVEVPHQHAVACAHPDAPIGSYHRLMRNQFKPPSGTLGPTDVDTHDFIIQMFHGITVPPMWPPELSCVASCYAVVSAKDITAACSVLDTPRLVVMVPLRYAGYKTVALIEYETVEAVYRALSLSGRRVFDVILYIELLIDYLPKTPESESD